MFLELDGAWGAASPQCLLFPMRRNSDILALTLTLLPEGEGSEITPYASRLP